MIEPTCSQRDAASVLFNLSGYRVVEAVDGPLGIRKVVVESLDREGGCPSCGVLTCRVHQRTLQRVRDVQVGGAVEVWWRKRRFACIESGCGRRTFTEHTRQVPVRARCTVRLREAVLGAVAWAGRAVLEVAASFGVAWWTVQAVINTAAKAMANPDARPVRHLGIDEHRYRRVRFFRDPDTAKWCRYEPWMTTMVDLDTGVVLAWSTVAAAPASRHGCRPDRRPGGAVCRWWRSIPVRCSVRPSATPCPTRRCRSIIFIWSNLPTRCSPWSGRGSRATSRADAVAPSTLRGRTGGCCCAATTPCRRRPGHGWSKRCARTTRPRRSARPGVKEQLRTLLACGSLADTHEEKMRLGYYVMVADMPETWRLWETINAWWTEIEVFLITGVTNARTEAANTSNKQLKRTGRGYRNA